MAPARISVCGIAVLLGFLGCGGPEPGATPEESTEIFLQALFEENWKGACNLLDDASRNSARAAGDCAKGVRDIYAPVNQLSQSPQLKSRGGVREYKVIETGIIPRRVYTRQVEGKWLVTFFPPPDLQRGN
jgi:hypothetical protein